VLRVLNLQSRFACCKKENSIAALPASDHYSDCLRPSVHGSRTTCIKRPCSNVSSYTTSGPAALLIASSSDNRKNPRFRSPRSDVWQPKKRRSSPSSEPSLSRWENLQASFGDRQNFCVVIKADPGGSSKSYGSNGKPRVMSIPHISWFASAS
jgi:hypothetical protein